MAYDEHYASSIPGAVSSQKWIERIVDKTAKEIINIVIHSGNNIHPDNVYGYGVPDFQKAYNSGKR